MSQIPDLNTDPDSRNERNKRGARLAYEVGALWQRVRGLDRGKADTGHGHSMERVSSRAAKVYLGSNQSISSDAVIKVALDTAAFDPHSLFDSANNRLILDRVGMWTVNGVVSYSNSNTTGGLRRADISDADGPKAIAQVDPSGASITSVPVSTVMRATSTSDVVELFAGQDSGSALDVTDGEPWTFLSVAYLGS